MAKVICQDFTFNTVENRKNATDWLAKYIDRGWTVLAILDLTQPADHERLDCYREFWLTKDD